MAINVYAWPPVPAKGRSWLVHQPVARLRSVMSGKEQIQASQRARRLVDLEISGLNAGRMAGGYMEMLGRLLLGGAHGVRLSSWSPNWALDQIPRGGHDFLSIALTATATSSSGLAAWRIAGVPPGFPLMKPGERFRVGGALYQAVNRVVANASGVAIARVLTATSGSGALTLRAQETAVFRPESIPTAPQTPGADFIFRWSFREVFADEVGGFVDIDPWT